jgi:hypothetical protein
MGVLGFLRRRRWGLDFAEAMRRKEAEAISNLNFRFEMKCKDRAESKTKVKSGTKRLLGFRVNDATR